MESTSENNSTLVEVLQDSTSFSLDLFTILSDHLNHSTSSSVFLLENSVKIIL